MALDFKLPEIARYALWGGADAQGRFSKRIAQSDEILASVWQLDPGIRPVAEAKLDGEKKQANAELMQATDPKEAMRLHELVTSLAAQLNEAEERWCALQEEINEE